MFYEFAELFVIALDFTFLASIFEINRYLASYLRLRYEAHKNWFIEKMLEFFSVWMDFMNARFDP